MRHAFLNGVSLGFQQSAKVSALFQKTRRGVHDMPGPVQRLLLELAGGASNEGVLDINILKKQTDMARIEKLKEFDLEFDGILRQAAAFGFSDIELTADNSGLKVHSPQCVQGRRFRTHLSWMMQGSPSPLEKHLRAKGFAVNSPVLQHDGRTFKLSWA